MQYFFIHLKILLEVFTGFKTGLDTQTRQKILLVMRNIFTLQYILQVGTPTDSDYSEFVMNMQTGFDEVVQMINASWENENNSVFVQMEFILSLMKSLQYIVNTGDTALMSQAIQHILSKLNALQMQSTDNNVANAIALVIKNLSTLQSGQINISNIQNMIAKIRKDLNEVIRRDRIYIKVSNIEFLIQSFVSIANSGAKKAGGSLKQVLNAFQNKPKLSTKK